MIQIDKKIRQAILLLLSTGLSMICLLIANFYLVRIVDPIVFGNFYFILNIYTFLQTILNFGFYQSIGRLAALSKNRFEEQRLYGIGLLISTLLYLLLLIILFIYISFSSIVFDRNLELALVWTMPVGWIYLLLSFNELYFQGCNNINLLSVLRFCPKFLFLLVIIIVYITQFELSLESLLILYFLSFSCILLLLVFKIRPKLTYIKSELFRVLLANRSFGFNIYLGALVAVGVGNLSGVLIGYFDVDNTSVGFYNIALQFTVPLALIPNILATVFFKEFVRADKIRTKLILITSIATFGGLVFILLIIKYIILFVYGDAYLPAVSLTYLLSIGTILYGLSDFFNRFLLSKGKGKELRNISIVVGVVLLIANIILIYNYGAKGAAFSKIVAGLFYLGIVVVIYKKIVKSN